jgi:hypothetical protein
MGRRCTQINADDCRRQKVKNSEDLAKQDLLLTGMKGINGMMHEGQNKKVIYPFHPVHPCLNGLFHSLELLIR